MAFLFTGIGTVGAQSRSGNSFQIFNYATNDDISDVSASGYFNQMYGKLRVKDIIWCFRQDTNGNNTEDFFLRVTAAPLNGNITTEQIIVNWKINNYGDLEPLDPTIDVVIPQGNFTLTQGDIELTAGNITIGGLTASQIVHTDSGKQLVSIAINTAYNKNFGVNNDDVPNIATTLGNDEILETDGYGSLITASKNTAYNKNFGVNNDDVPNIATTLGNDQTLETDGYGSLITAIKNTAYNQNFEDYDANILSDIDTASDAGASDNVARADHRHVKVNATESVVGQVELATNAETISGVSTTLATHPAGVNAAINTYLGLPKNYITGLVISNDTDTEHDIAISAGECRSSDDTYDIVLSSVLTKRIDANWAAGDDAGGFPSSLTLSANTTYHKFVIYNPTTDTTDAGYDTSLTATNLLADATGYTKYRRIGSVITDASSNIKQFIKRGLDYWLKTPEPAGSFNQTTAALETLTVPTGISVIARVSAWLICGGSYTLTQIFGYLHSGNVPAVNASSTAYQLFGERDQGKYNAMASAEIEVDTDTSGRIYASVTHLDTTNTNILVLGWNDYKILEGV